MKPVIQSGPNALAVLTTPLTLAQELHTSLTHFRQPPVNWVLHNIVTNKVSPKPRGAIGVISCFSVGFHELILLVIISASNVPAASIRMLSTRAAVVNISMNNPWVRLVSAPRETLTMSGPWVSPSRMAEATIAPTS